MSELTNPSILSFDSTASHPQNGVALIFDLEGFSHFFNQPDVQDYVPKFLNHVYDAIRVSIYGGKAYWDRTPDVPMDPLIPPIHEKFLGDGSLYVWTFQDKKDPSNFLNLLSNRLWNLKKHFHKIARHSMDDVPVAELPSKIRFGIARGTIIELTVSGRSQHEYVGVCINLASRLQKYCPDLGFIASARLGLPQTVLDEDGYIKVIATKLKGFPKEIVIVDKNEFTKLTPQTRDSLFTTL